jgi:hypothetical protein
MKTALLLLTGAKLELPQKIAQQRDQEWQIESVDLTRKDVDYRAVLEKIFSADSVQVW